MPVDPVVHLLLQLGGALLFGSAAVHKLRDPAAFRSALAGYQLLPDGLVPLAAKTLPWIEFGAGAALLTPGWRVLGAAIGAALLFVYSGAIAANLVRGRREIDCGCGGVGGPRPLGTSLLVRNGVLIVGLSWLVAPAVSRELAVLDFVTLFLATGALAILYAAIDVALANGARQREAA